MREIEHDIYRQPVDGQSEVRLNPGEGTIVPPESDVAQIKAGNTVVELVRIGSERAEALGFTADLMRTPYVLVDPMTFGTGAENDRTDPVFKPGWKGLWPGKSVTIGRDIGSDDELRKHGGFDFRSNQTMSKRHFTLSLDEESIPHIQDIGSTNGTEVRFSQVEKETQLSEDYQDMVNFIHQNWQEIVDVSTETLSNYFYRRFVCKDRAIENFDYAQAEESTRQYLAAATRLMARGEGRETDQPAWMWMISKREMERSEVTSRVYLNVDRSQVAQIMQAIIEYSNQRSLRVEIKATNPRRMIPHSEQMPATDLPEAARNLARIDPVWTRHFNERPDACVLYCHREDVRQIFEYVRWLYETYPQVFQDIGTEFAVPIKDYQGKPIKAAGFASQPVNTKLSFGDIVADGMRDIVQDFRGSKVPPPKEELVKRFQAAMQKSDRDIHQPGLSAQFKEMNPDIAQQLAL
ncbi:FHA domain-containing protein [Candidatus Saccharibacteria bacterium]|nr:FHA domain-containing protein [Candidatus Saccharibacteria bacterium]